MRALTLLLGSRGFDDAGMSFRLPPVGRWFRVAAERRRLAELDDAALRDIGLTRDDVIAEASRPFWDTKR